MNWNADDIARLESLLKFRDEIVALPKLAQRVEGTERAVTAITRRVDALAMTEEHAKQIEALQKAHLDEKFGALKEDIDRVGAQIVAFQSRIESAVKWFVMAVTGAVVAFVVTFALNGGFRVPL